MVANDGGGALRMTRPRLETLEEREAHPPAGERPRDRGVAAIAWAPSESRPRALVSALGGEARAFFDFRLVWRPLVPLRYAISAGRTLAYLARRRPKAVIAQAPPVPAALLAWVYGRLSGAPVVIDSHPAAFAMETARVDKLMLPLLRWLARRSAGLIVTTPELARRVDAWGGRPLIVHEPPIAVAPAPAPDGVLFVSTFAPDEPLEAVLEAARALPDVHFRVTGDVRRKPLGLRAPDNVEWVGYLRGESYWRTLARSAVILSLTKRRQAVLRSAYEAVYALRPLIVSGWPHMEELFPYATHVTNDAQSIAAGVRRALASGADSSALDSARELQLARWRDQLTALRTAIGERP